MRDYQQLFDACLDRILVEDIEENGQWRGDMMGDAAAFGPRLLLALAEVGHPDGRRFRHRARRSIYRSLEKIRSLLMGNVFVLRDAVIGAPCLLDGYATTRNDGYAALAFLGLAAVGAGAVVLRGPAARLLLDPVVVMACGAHTSLSLAIITGRRLPGLLGAWLARANHERHHGPSGLYGSPASLVSPLPWDWQQACSLMALAKLETVSPSPTGRRWSDALDQAVRRELWDEARGGFWASRTHKGKGLSGNAIFLQAYLDRFEARAHPSDLDRARALLDFMEIDLFDGSRLVHHWTSEEGPATSYCTGCILFVLGSVLRYWRFTETRRRG